MLFLEIVSCEGDIIFFVKCYDLDIRWWFFDDFCKWFCDLGDFRVYVFLGDLGVGKSVMVGVMV